MGEQKTWLQKEMKPSPPCESCTGLCCTNKSGWQFVTLTVLEQKNPVFAGKAVPLKLFTRDRRKGFVFEDGACPFLDRLSNRCTVYHERPTICRQFDCRLHAPPQFFRLNPTMVDLIVAHETKADWSPPVE